MHRLSLPVKVVRDDVTPPAYAHPGDAGLDLCAVHSLTLEPFERSVMPTGIAVAIPQGYAGLVLPRSGSAVKRGLSLPNTPGLIDSGYRGELQVALVNLDANQAIHIQPGDRIAQLVLVPVAAAQLIVVDDLDDTDRGAGGFGSTGA